MSMLIRSRPALTRSPPLRVRPPALIAWQRRAPAPWATTAPPVPPQPALVDQGPYLDYSRSLTPAGGVLIIYKDLDLRWRQYVWKAAAWLAASATEAWYLQTQSPLQSAWLDLLCWLIAAGLNLLIVWQRVEVCRRIEIRQDCLILEGEEVFWREHMTGEGPQFAPDEEDNLILGGVYGTRFVEFATLRRFDEFDRMPETFATHFEEAVQQLWQTA